MTTQQPEALRLAAWLNQGGWPSYVPQEAAAELLRQHARIVELETQLAAIGAGRVDPLRKPTPTAQAAPDERAAFEAWLGIKPCGAAHDFGWAAWQARAAIAAQAKQGAHP